MAKSSSLVGPMMPEFIREAREALARPIEIVAPKEKMGPPKPKSRRELFLDGVARKEAETVADFSGVVIQVREYVGKECVHQESRTWDGRRDLADYETKKGKRVTLYIAGKLPECGLRRGLESILPQEMVVWSMAAKTGGYRPAFDLPSGSRITKIKVPGRMRLENKSVFEKALAEKLAESSVTFARVEGGHITLIRGAGDWMSCFSGVNAVVSPKIDKRTGLFTNLYPMVLRLQVAEVTIKVIEDLALENVLDGIVHMSERLFQLLVDTIHVPGNVERAEIDAAKMAVSRRGKNAVATKTELAIAKVREKRSAEWQTKAQKQRAAECKLHHGKVLIPEELGGQGIKGHLCVSKDLEADIVVHRVNIKHELNGSKDWLVCLEPNGPRNEARTDVQLTYAFDCLVPMAEQAKWMKAWAKWVVTKKIFEGELLDDFGRMIRAQRRIDNAENMDAGALVARWAALYLVEAGVDFRHSPAMVSQIAKSHLRSLLPENGKLNVPLPACCDWQIVSQMAATLAGSKLAAEVGEVRLDKEFGFGVVADETWREMAKVHGGADLDDHFLLLFRMISGKKAVVALRRPMDRGEYTVLKYRDGDYRPTTAWWADEKWPVVDISNIGKRGNEAGKLKDGTPRKYIGQTYSMDAFWDGVDRASEGSNPGDVINAKMLWNGCNLGQQVEPLAYTMEQVVDANIQGGSPELIRKIKEWGRKLVTLALATGKPIDKEFWENRGFRLSKGDKQPNLGSGRLSKLSAVARSLVAKMRREVDVWTQKHHEVPLPLQALAATITPEEEHLARMRLKEHRRAVAEGMEDGLDSKAMDKLYTNLKASLGGMDAGKFAFVVHTTARANGTYNDAVLLSKHFVAEYVEALIFNS